MIPILMDNTKTLTELVNDNTCVLRLTDATECTVEEEANGAYTATITLPLTEEYRNTLTDNAIIKIKANPYDSLQLFRVYKATTTMDSIELELRHITYDLSKTSVLPCTATSAAEAMQNIKNSMQGGDAFTLATKLDTKANFKNLIPQSARALFGGQEGSLLDIYGGYYYWDNLTVTLGKRGSDSGVTIRYGKNLTTAEQERELASMYTAVQPYATRDDVTTVGTYKTLIENANPVMVLNLDTSEYFDTEEEITVAKIDLYCEKYVNSNNLTTPKVSISIEYEDLQKYGEQYKEEVKLCDAVHVIFEKLGINATARVVSYKYDSLAEKYTSVEIGNVKSSLSSTISSVASKATEAVKSLVNAQQATVNAFSNLITNGLGLFETKETQPDGSVKLYLHNKPKMADSSVWYTINSDGFAISRDHGATWTAGIDADGNAVVNALSANVIKALQIYGSYIYGSTIKSPNLIFQADNSGTYDIRVQQGTVQTKDGTYYGIAASNALACLYTFLGYIGLNSSGLLNLLADGNITISSQKELFISGKNKAYLYSGSYEGIMWDTDHRFSLQGSKDGSSAFTLLYYYPSQNNGRVTIAQSDTRSGTPAVGYAQEIGFSISNNRLWVFKDGTQVGSIALS